MGAFNTLRINAPCPICGSCAVKEIQFKHGEVWQYEYRAGDKLRGAPGEPDERGKRHLDGITHCSVCETQGLKCEIAINDGVLSSATILPVMISPTARPQKERRHGRAKGKR